MNIIKLDSVNSTNTYCNYLLTNPSGLPDAIRPADTSLPVAVIAREQYAGRGRYGKNFFSPAESGIYLSYAYEGKYAEADLLKITVIVASIVHQILSKYSSDNLSIKWINDIYRGSKKIAGILCERVDDPASSKYYLIIGVGVNVTPCEVPSELEQVIGFLSDSCDEHLIDQITNDLISSLDAVLGKCSTSEFPDLAEYYRSHCIGLPADLGDELFSK